MKYNRSTFNRQQKIAFGVFAIIGIVVYVSLMVLLQEDLTWYSLDSILWLSLIYGLFLGVGIPFIIKIITPLLEKSVDAPQLKENEKIILEGRANLFNNWWIALGGKMFITDKRLIFSSHKFNFQKKEIAIELENINKIIKRKTAYLVDNGLRIQTLDDSKFDFVVDNRAEWVERLDRYKRG